MTYLTHKRFLLSLGQIERARLRLIQDDKGIVSSACMKKVVSADLATFDRRHDRVRRVKRALALNPVPNVAPCALLAPQPILERLAWLHDQRRFDRPPKPTRQCLTRTRPNLQHPSGGSGKSHQHGRHQVDINKQSPR